ncbi:MAG: EamA family transporter, partial [Sulfurovum sp.]
YIGSKMLWIEALHRTSVTKVSAMMGLMPVFTLIFAYFYLGEVPEFRQVIGVIPVLIGGYLLTRPIR